MSHRSLLTVLVILASCLPAAAQTAPVPALTTYRLPASMTFPEGVAYDGMGALYTASAENGSIVRVAVASRQAQVIAPAGTLVPVGVGSAAYFTDTQEAENAVHAGRSAGGDTGWTVNTGDGPPATGDRKQLFSRRPWPAACCRSSL